MKSKVKMTKSGDIKGKWGKILVIVLKEGKGSVWRWIADYETRFSIDGHNYEKVGEGTYLKGNSSTRFMVYLEGIALPIHSGIIERETKIQARTDLLTGETLNEEVSKIKGINVDSGIQDMLLNRNLISELTRQHMDLPNLLIIIMLIVNIIFGIANIGMWYL